MRLTRPSTQTVTSIARRFCGAQPQLAGRAIGSLILSLPLLLNPELGNGHGFHARTPSTGYGYQLNWKADHINRVIAGQEFDFRGGASLPNISPVSDPGKIRIIDGKECLVGGYFLFDVSDDFIFDTDETIVLRVLVDREVTQSFAVTYDGAGGPGSRVVHIDQGTSRWQWENVALERARFANRRFGVDFGIAETASQVKDVAEYGFDVLGTSGDAQQGRQGLAICDIEIIRDRNPPAAPQVHGHIRLIVRNESGSPTPARVGLYRSDGWSPLPSESALQMILSELPHDQVYLIDGQENWPGKGRYVFFTRGSYEVEVPVGSYQVVIAKGFEYEVVDRTISVVPNEEVELDITLDRWVNMPENGWYSGDAHIHLARNHAVDDDWISTLARAEDVHVMNMLEMAGWAVPGFFTNYAFGVEGHHIVGDYALIPGQENPTTYELGHGLAHNATRPFVSTNMYDYVDFIDKVQAAGGIFGFAHLVYHPLLNPHRALALHAPLGIVDFVEVLQGGTLGLTVYYDFLNLGFKLVPAAGSDFPFLNLPGSERSYVKIDGDFTPQKYFDGFKQGHTFVTSGPMLEFEVNGAAMGSEIDVSGGDPLQIRAVATLNPSLGDLDRLELVAHGDVVAVVEADGGSQQLVLDETLSAEGSMWLAARAYGSGENPTEAHTAPVYVYVNGNESFVKRPVVADLSAKIIADLDEFLVAHPAWSRQQGRRMADESLMVQQWEEQLPRLKKLVIQAKEYYEELSSLH